VSAITRAQQIGIGRKMMRAEIEKQLEELIETTTSEAAIEEWKRSSERQELPLYNYRGDHVEQVVKLAKYLASGTQADMDVVMLAAWLHDYSKPGIGGVSAENHGRASSKFAEGWLKEREFDSLLIARVCEAIEQHVGLVLKKPLESIEAQIIWEADKIYKLGLVGILQYVLNGIRFQPGLTLEEYHTRLVEFLPLAQKIAASMATEKGKRLASKRLKTLESLVETLGYELDCK
jgi:HD superfamily phosphodiesterase